jgi:hypothetical protein
MKKLVFIFTILIFEMLNLKAQSNGGFENWSLSFGIEDPDTWQTLNFFSVYPVNSLSAFKVSGVDKHSGNFALKLKTVYIQNNPNPSLTGDTTGGIFTGKITFSPFAYQYGFPYTGRPEKLDFWSKYIPVGADTAGAVVVLKRWNGFYTDTIAVGSLFINATPGYTKFSVDLVYYSTEIPDSAFVGFASSKSSNIARINSTLYVDDVTFTGWVGINKYEKNVGAVKLYPNPANDYLNISTTFPEADNIAIKDISGKFIGVYNIQNYLVSINTGLFEDGIYFFQIHDKKGAILTNGKFSVVK